MSIVSRIRLALSNMMKARFRKQSESHNTHSQLSHLKSVQTRQVQHVIFTLPISFEKFTSAFQARLPFYDLKLFRNIHQFDPANDVEHFTAVLNDQPFAIFAQRSFGLFDTVPSSSLNSLPKGRKGRGVVRYEIGHVVLAMGMTIQDVSVALYVPHSIAVWETADGCTVVEWDCLVDQIGQEAGEKVKEIATTVDEDRELVVLEVYQEVLKREGKS